MLIRNPGIRRVIVFGTLTIALSVDLAVVPHRTHADAGGVRLSFSKGMKLQDVLGVLEEYTPGVCVADASSLELTLTSDITSETEIEALNRISADLDLYWIRQGRLLVLQRRYTESDEEVALELEEVRQSLTDLYRLIRPFTRRLMDVSFIQNQNRFAGTLTQQQMDAMINGGLPFTALSKQQQQAWINLNAEHAFGATTLDFERAAQCLTVWSRARLETRVNGDSKPTSLTVSFPDPNIPGGTGQCRVRLADTKGKGNSRPRAPMGMVSSEVPTFPKELTGKWDLRSSCLGLRTLADKMNANFQSKLEVPHYAEGRKVWCYSRGGSRGEVLAAIKLLWNWDLVRTKQGYKLGRPVFSPAPNPAELHVRLLRAVPPALLHPVRNSLAGADGRMRRQADLVAKNAMAAGASGQTQIAVSKLDDLNERRLANCVAVRQLFQWYSALGRRASPPLWLSQPEAGVLRLSGPMGPDKHPMLKFSVSRGDGKREFWGWLVNSSAILR